MDRIGAPTLPQNQCITVSYPNDVVEADTINTFKNRLDKYWSNQHVLFNFNADLIVTESLPICM